VGLSRRLKDSLFPTIDQDDRTEFRRQAAAWNLGRLRALAVLIIVLEPILVVFNFTIWRDVFNSPGAGYTLWPHTLLRLSTALAAVIFLAIARDRPGESGRLQLVENVFLTYIMASHAAATGLVHAVTHSIGGYLVGVFLCATFVHYQSPQNPLLYLMTYLVYAVLVLYNAPALKSVRIDLVNSALMTLGAATVSQVLHTGLVREFHQQKVITTRNLELQQALDQVKQLSGLLPICSHCKRIRNDQGYWEQVEIYVRDHSEAQFTHGICPDCLKKLYPNLGKKKEGPENPTET
jgi:hypothetical protein